MPRASETESSYQRFRVAPQPGGGITSAKAHHISPHGAITRTWHLTHDHGELNLTVPHGTGRRYVSSALMSTMSSVASFSRSAHTEAGSEDGGSRATT